jgi:hypothetical protein
MPFSLKHVVGWRIVATETKNADVEEALSFSTKDQLAWSYYEPRSSSRNPWQEKILALAVSSHDVNKLPLPIETHAKPISLPTPPGTFARFWKSFG